MGLADDSPDDAVDRLFELPPEEFVEARNALARRLKNEGNPEAAEEVRQLKKPNVAAWAINQLSRQHKDALTVLLDAAVGLREAQERALQSGESGDALRRAQAEERQAMRELTPKAQQVLEDVGRPVTSTVLTRISSTLRAAAISEGGRAALKAGLLSGDVKPSGFDAFAGLEVSDEPRLRSAPALDELSERRREKEERQRKRRDLRERARKLAALAREDERRAERAEQAATDARSAAEKSRREAEEAAADLEKLDR